MTRICRAETEAEKAERRAFVRAAAPVLYAATHDHEKAVSVALQLWIVIREAGC